MSTEILTLKEIEQLLSDGLSGVKSQLLSVAGVDSAIVTDFILRTQKRSAIIISGFATGDIDITEFKALLIDEKYILTGFLDTMVIVAKVDAQDLFKKITMSIADILIKIILPV